MGLALNLVALLLVLALSWGAMVAMAAWAHRQRIPGGPGVSFDDADAQPCPACDAVGARRRLGRLEPCPLCEGRGLVIGDSRLPPGLPPN